MDLLAQAKIEALTTQITAIQDQMQVLTDLAATQATILADLRARVKALEAQAHPPFITASTSTDHTIAPAPFTTPPRP